MNEIAISVQNVSKCYRAFEDQRSRFMHALWPSYTRGMREVWALRDINFEINRGESVAIIGRNGGGKSTLLEILTGTLSPTTGKVNVNGRVSALLELGSGFNPEYSGRDNVVLNGLLLGLSKEAIIDRFSEIEAFAEIGDAIDRPVKTYSSGMLMRLAFAVQVLCDPDILIIDEALSVGDFFFQQKCLSYIRGLCAKGVTLLFVSHDMGTVRDLCERGILLKRGSVFFDGEKIGAIRKYLNADGNALAPAANIENAIACKNSPSGARFEIFDPIWSCFEELVSSKQNIKARILAVGFEDDSGRPIHSIKMGGNVIFKIHYKVFTEEPVHVVLIIKNKYDQVVTCVGSLNLKVLPPKLQFGQDAIFQLATQLSIESAEYAISVSLAQPDITQTHGVVIDEVNGIGPIQVQWNYNEDIPPFFGAFGLNSSAQFLIEPLKTHFK
jgi:lipopolysaccharide transport system ATP-binding protein